MTRVIVADLFVEDRAHEELLKPLIRRVAAEERVRTALRVRCARGGHGRVLEELRLYLRLLEKGALGHGLPDVLVVATDGNCATFASRRAEVQAIVAGALEDRLITGCPDPHVERWYLADPEACQAVVGYRPPVVLQKCERDYYKRVLADAVRQGGNPLTLGGIEFAAELAAGMDLYRAGKNDPSFRAFVDDLRAKLRRLGRLS